MLPVLHTMRMPQGRIRPVYEAAKQPCQIANPPIDLLARLQASDDPVRILVKAYMQNPFNLRQYLSCNRYFFQRVVVIDLASYSDELMLGTPAQLALFDDFVAILLENLPLLKYCTKFTLQRAGTSKQLFSTLPQLGQLRAVALPCCGLTSVAFLAGMNNMAALNVSGNYLLDFDALIALDKLEALNIRATGVQDTRFLKSLRQLTCLDVSENQMISIGPILGIAKQLHQLFMQKTRPLEYFEVKIIMQSRALECGAVDIEWAAFRMLGKAIMPAALKVNCATYGAGKIDRKYVQGQRQKYYLYRRFGFVAERDTRYSILRSSCASLSDTARSCFSDACGGECAAPMCDRLRVAEVCAMLQCIDQ